ncbi:hypothetical protein MCEL_34480 [Mycolicibacterium celeriflavum]|uniref:Uncharacterized protein n=1 Tax=Mycolicibacterium celeriflavum TaxID=1249101 RepID=A0A7I7RKW5_MYCCF|nr:hypothetical protein MCEL_34480 [Mycolicibacterium celeriflavum]
MLGVETHPPIAQGRVQTAHPGDVVCHASPPSSVRDFLKPTRFWPKLGPTRHAGLGLLRSHTSPVSFATGVLIGLSLLVSPAATLDWRYATA